MNIELEQIAPYFPYNLQCQFLGIINGRELSEQNKKFKADNFPFDFIEPEYGLKVAPLKEVRIFKKYWKAYIGIYRIGLKSFANGYGFKPLLIPMSKLTRAELEQQGFHSHIDFLTYEKRNPVGEQGQYNWRDGAPWEMVQYCFSKHFDVFGLIDKGLAIDKTLAVSS